MPCQSLTAAEYTRHVTNAEMIHQYLKKENTAKLPIECDAHLEIAAIFFLLAAIFSFFLPWQKQSTRAAESPHPPVL